MGDFSHLSEAGEAAMVDVGGKPATQRRATVRGRVEVSADCLGKLGAEGAREVARTARIAAIQAAKQTAALVPMCHPIPLAGVKVDIALDASGHAFSIEVTTSTQASTGVEMEALCAATIAGATIYDMIKAVAPDAVVGPFFLVEKTGGKTGSWRRPS
jgi:cyclic pyranopterin phosphate synthase